MLFYHLCLNPAFCANTLESTTKGHFNIVMNDFLGGNTMKKILFTLSTLALLSTALVGCNKTSTSSTKPVDSSTSEKASDSSAAEPTRTKTVASYVNSDIQAPGNYGDGSWNTYSYQVNFYENNVYEYITTELIYGYSMSLGTTSIINYGTYTKGDSEDGITTYTLNIAKEVIFNSYSLAGGYNISINTTNQSYPVEMLAKTQGEKNMANSKEDVIKEYGAGTTIYTNDGKNTFSFKNENLDAEAPAVTTASGDVSSLLIRKVTKCQIVSDLITPGSYGEGSWTADIYQVNTFEDDTYEFIKTEVIYGYSMNLGTTIINNYGKYSYGTGEDGYTPITLEDADKVLFNSYSLAGGYNISINTDNQTYPVELLAKNQGEKNMADSKDDVVKEYGAKRTYYSNDTKNILSLTNPNA